MAKPDELRGVASRLPTPSAVVSYAQNFEDFRLWRALSTVDRGCYVDIGAGHPYDMSVTRLFYEHGWRGVNVEQAWGMQNW